MKLSKNSVLAAVLCVICVGVVAVCLYPGRTDRSDFTPDTPANNTPLIWEDKLGFGESNSAPTNHSGVSTAAPNEYPKQSVDSEGNVSVEFTPDAEDLMPDEPEAPISEDDYTNQEAPPSYKPE